jgi:hypothetical protein
MDRKEPRAGKFTLDKESPIQGEESAASRVRESEEILCMTRIDMNAR